MRLTSTEKKISVCASVLFSNIKCVTCSFLEKTSTFAARSNPVSQVLFLKVVYTATTSQQTKILLLFRLYLKG